MKKDFDCVAMKRRAQENIRSQVAGKTRSEEIAFFREGANEFEQRLADARTSAARSARAGT